MAFLGPHPWGDGRWKGSHGDVVGSLNCMEWSLLPPATEEMVTPTSVVKGRFMGDPSHEYEHTELQKVNEGEKVFEEEVVVSEDRRRRGPVCKRPGPPKPSPADTAAPATVTLTAPVASLAWSAGRLRPCATVPVITSFSQLWEVSWYITRW